MDGNGVTGSRYVDELVNTNPVVTIQGDNLFRLDADLAIITGVPKGWVYGGTEINSTTAEFYPSGICKGTYTVTCAFCKFK